MRSYVSFAKTLNPKISKDLHQFIIDKYIEKRRANVESKAGYAYTTPRTLLAIIRLSQAMARIRLSEDVDQNDVDESLRLMEMSQASVLESLEDGDIGIQKGNSRTLNLFSNPKSGYHFFNILDYY